MIYPSTALATLEALYQLGANICAEIDTFHPEVIIGLAHSGWLPVVVAQALWAQTKADAFPPSLRTNIGREKHEFYAARYGDSAPAFCCIECGADRVGHYIAWVAGQNAWLQTLRGQIEQVYPGVPSRILVVDDVFGGRRSGFTVLALLDALYPKSKAYVLVGQADLTNDLVMAWLEEFLPDLSRNVLENSTGRGRYRHPWHELLKPLVTGTEDITPGGLDWRTLGPDSPAVKALVEFLPVDAILSAPGWVENLACGYAIQRQQGIITPSIPEPSSNDRRYLPLSRRLSLSAEDRLVARAWQKNGATLGDIAEIFGDTPDGLEKGLKTVAVDYVWHRHGQAGDAVYYPIDALESWITVYDLYKQNEPNLAPPNRLDPCGFAEFVPGQVWAGAYPLASDIQVKDQPFKDLLSAGVDTFISLIGPGEEYQRWPYRKALSQVSEELGKNVRVYAFPLPFRESPAPEEMRKILRSITRALKSGRRIYLHAGHNLEGRAPMLLACLLIQQGYAPEQALIEVNGFWLKTLPFLIYSPLTGAQTKFVQDWGKDTSS